MIDIHCHILPATDDGPQNWDRTLEMCERAASDGVTHIVATPHCNHRYPYDRVASQGKINQLRSRFPEIDFSLGCELSMTDKNLEEAIRHPEGFVIGETSYLLVEAHEAYMPKQVEDALDELISIGLTPILAHPERNPHMRRSPELLERWIGMGCLSALTGNSLTGFWGNDIKRAAESMLRDGLAHFLVSDAHDPSSRPPVLADALSAASKIIGSKRAHELVWANPSSVVQNETVVA